MKLLVVLRAGEPLSVTLTVTVFTLGPSASVGVHEIAPLAATVSPLGPETLAKVREFAGISESVAVAVAL